ncbi:sulfatase [Candidatus Hydrogenedentota bacterium]
MNILFVMCDTLRADYLGRYGNKWIKTPNIDKLAADGTLFTNCYAEGQATLQARRAIMTGRRTFPWKDDKIIPGDHLNMQPGWQPINEEYWTLSEALRNNGFYTGFVTDVGQFFKPGMNFHRGFDTYDFIRGQMCDYVDGPLAWDTLPKENLTASGRRKQRRVLSTKVPVDKPEEEHFAAITYKRAGEWLNAHSCVDKTMLWADTFDPHEPWTPPENYLGLYTKEELLTEPYVLSEEEECSSEDALAAMREVYAAEVTMVDTWVGHLLDRLEESGRKDDTVVVFHSDHGLPLGHAGYGHKKGRSMYACQSRTPLIVCHPEGLGAGRKVDALCYNMDIFPTLLELVGAPLPEDLDAKSLVPFMRGDTTPIRDCVTSGYNEWIMYRDLEWLMCQTVEGEGTILIDLEADPDEVNNIAEGNETLVNKLRAKLEAECGGFPDPWPVPGWPAPPEFQAKFPRIFRVI